MMAILPAKSQLAISALLAAVLMIQADAQSPDEAVRMIDSLRELPVGLGNLPEVDIPRDNPASPLKSELGRRLFLDTRLSGSGTMSCATCHDPQRGFSDGRQRAVGSHGKRLPRHTPTLVNVGYNPYQFWDGRATSLEQQVIEPLTSPREMSMTDQGELIKRLDADPQYHAIFRVVFEAPPDMANVAKALAAYERTILSRGSSFDRYARGDKQALTASEKKGLVLFIGKARCARCHNGPNFTDNRFHNTGIGRDDDGRFRVTKDLADRANFKTPGLRNVFQHPPYMHDGSLSTLGAVIDYYDRGGNAVRGKSAFIYPIGLSPVEKQELLAFLKALDDDVESAPKHP